jgi:hypothetical protein
MSQAPSLRLACLLVVAALIPACGGGGSGGGPPAPPPPTPLTPAVVQFAVTAETVAEGTLVGATLTVNRVGGTGQTVSVQFATGDLTATDTLDYTGTSGTLEWLEADFAPKQINIAIADLDILVEGEETFKVTLSAPTGATLGANTEATVTITDGDAPPEGVFQFSATAYNVTEDAAGNINVEIRVRRTGATDTTEAASVNCVVTGGTATAPTDFTDFGTATLNWAIGDASDQVFNIQILNDGLDGAGVETILLALQSPLPAFGPEVSVSQGTAVVNITDADQFGDLQFEFPAYEVSENGASITINVKRVGGSSGAVSATVSLSGGVPPANAGVDYTNPGAITLNWGVGDTADQPFTINVIDNAIADGSRILMMTLTPLGGATAGAPAPLTITDEDAGIFRFSTDQYSALEADGAITVTVERVVGSAGTAEVDVNIVAGTATLTADYTVVNSPEHLIFADGEVSKSFVITIVDEAAFEADETISLSLSTPVGASIGLPSSATATITNDDAPPGGTITLSSATYAVTEGTPSLIVTVNRSGLTALPVSVTIKSINGTARGNGKKKDYTAVNQLVTFLATETTKPVTIFINDDTVVEVLENFRVQLSGPTNQSVLGTPSTATITITSNE